MEHAVDDVGQGCRYCGAYPDSRCSECGVWLCFVCWAMHNHDGVAIRGTIRGESA